MSAGVRMKKNKITIDELLDEKRVDWPGACSLMIEIEDYGGICGRCGWSFEDHEYLQEAIEFEHEVDGEIQSFWALPKV